MANPFYLIWQQNGQLLRGYQNGEWVEGQLTFPIAFPGVTTDPQIITLQTSAAANQTYETLVDVGFYLVGSDVAMVQGQWPYLGDTYTPPQAQLNGGFEISFDGGNTWTLFTNTAGVANQPSTWIPLVATAIGSNGVNGQLGAFDVATLNVRYVIPPQVNLTKVLDVQLAAGFDIA
jgi:hypothetical protein